MSFYKNDEFSNDIYFQCKLKNKNRIIYTWLHKKFAIENIKLELRNNNRDWESDWVVIKVFKGVKRTEKELLNRANDHKKQRKASDI